MPHLGQQIHVFLNESVYKTWYSGVQHSGHSNNSFGVSMDIISHLVSLGPARVSHITPKTLNKKIRKLGLAGIKGTFHNYIY